ncbi:Amine oxidase [flavin-containing] [Blattella germanica]|nr:Amine oxidase [flavin-containing] [Blattella germanica]
MSTKTTVVIVGAGLSGLSAATLLQEHNVDVVVLEANDRVGGRTYTVNPSQEAGDPQYGWVDLGASYVGPSQNHVLRMCKKLGLETYLCRDDHDNIHYSRGRKCRYTSSWPSFWWSNPFAAWDLRAVILKLQEMVDEVPSDCPWKAPKAAEWDKMTLKEFLEKQCWTSDAKEFLEAMCVVNNTAEDHQVSLLFFLWYLQQGRGINRIWRIKGGAQERKIIGGSQQISLKMAQKLKAPCYAKQKLKIHFDPPLPSLRNGLIQRCPMGLVIKWVGFYRKEFWVEKGLNGFVTCMDGIEVVGNVAEDYKPGTVHVEDKIWVEESYVGGCYTSYYPPGVLSQYGSAIREPIGGRIFIAGTESAVKWTGYMDGAIESGERAAREVLHAQGKISSKEIWVEEPESLEVPVLPLQLPWLEKHQPSLKTLFATSVAMVSLIIAFTSFGDVTR